MKKDHLEIVLEDMNGKFDLVLEGHEGLRHEIRELARKTVERFDLVDLKFEAMNNKIGTVEAKLNNKIDAVATDLNQKIDTVAADLSQKIGMVAAELNEHRDNTEAHHGVYRVKEEQE